MHTASHRRSPALCVVVHVDLQVKFSEHFAVAHRDPAQEPLVHALRAHGTLDGWGTGPVLRVLRSRSSEVYSEIDSATLEHLVNSPVGQQERN